MSPRSLHRVLALAEAITWALLLTGMFLKYVTRTTELGVRIGGGIHGFVFLLFCVTVVAVAVDGRWGVGRMLLGLAAAVVPFATIPYERWAERKGLLADRWRLQDEPGASAPERLLAWALRNPVLAVVVAVAVVAIVFTGLLLIGPPGS
ncbi:DUF3817 domain-containing protein [Kytococcus sp. Marseille-QA3725]